MADDGNGYPRILDRDGCLYGQSHAATSASAIKTLHIRIDNLEANMEKLEKKIDRLTWALVGLSLSIATASVTIWLR